MTSLASSIRPPITTVCPVRTRALVSASRVVMTGALSAASTVCCVSWLASCRMRNDTNPSSLIVGITVS